MDDTILSPSNPEEFKILRSNNTRQDKRLDRLEQLARELAEKQWRPRWKKIFGG